MSVIAGIIRFDGEEADPAHAEAMTRWMQDRAADGLHFWTCGSVSLGFSQFCTTAQSLEDHQPLCNEDESLVLVMDGRVDNWEELRTSLQAAGAVLRSGSDTELVLRAYERWHYDCPDHIDGDFAFVVWDRQSNQAFCARDRFGVKPFYYHFDGRVFSFCSSVRPLVDLPYVKRVFNYRMAAEFLGARWLSLDETFWKDVLRLPPNTRMSIGAEGLQMQSYWYPELSVHSPALSDAEYVSRYRELLTDAVRRVSRSHCPVACEVSGGLDSSAVFALAEQLRRDGRLPSPGLQGYTLYFDPASNANDLPFARAVGAKLGREVLEVKPTLKPLAWSESEAERHAEFPSFPNGTMGLGIREMANQQGARALLVGIGADEQLSGGRTYYADALAAKKFNQFIRYLREDAADSGYPRALYWAFRHGLYRMLPKPFRAIMLRLLYLRGIGSRYLAGAWLPDVLNKNLAHRRLATPIPNDILASLSHPYSVWARENEGMMAACAGIELRYPFLDRRLVEFTCRMPSRQRIRGRFNKYTHRMALAGLLPEELLSRQDKANFMETFEHLLPEVVSWLWKNRQAAGLDALVNWSKLERVAKDAQRKGFGGWPEFMLWIIFGCGMLVKCQSGEPLMKKQQDQ